MSRLDTMGLLADVTTDAFIDDRVGITEDVAPRREAAVPDQALIPAHSSWT